MLHKWSTCITSCVFNAFLNASAANWGCFNGNYCRKSTSEMILNVIFVCLGKHQCNIRNWPVNKRSPIVSFRCISLCDKWIIKLNQSLLIIEMSIFKWMLYKSCSSPEGIHLCQEICNAGNGTVLKTSWMLFCTHCLLHRVNRRWFVSISDRCVITAC